MATFEELANRQASLIRKALSGSVFMGPMSAPAVSTFTDETGALSELPAGYEDFGWITKDGGATWSRETEVSEVTSWGSFDPTRRDMNSDVTSLAIVAQETNIRTLSAYYNVDLSGVTPAVGGEVVFEQSTRPNTRYMQIFALFQDGAGADAIYVGRYLPRAMVSEVGDQTWSDGDDPVAYEMTLTATPGDDGFSVRHLFGGPGWAALLEDMGFPAAPTA